MLKNTIFPITSNCLPQIKPNYETLQCTKLFLKNWNATSVGLSQGYSYTDKHIINSIQERTLISRIMNTILDSISWRDVDT